MVAAEDFLLDDSPRGYRAKVTTTMGVWFSSVLFRPLSLVGSLLSFIGSLLLPANRSAPPALPQSSTGAAAPRATRAVPVFVRGRADPVADNVRCYMSTKDTLEVRGGDVPHGFSVVYRTGLSDTVIPASTPFSLAEVDVAGSTWRVPLHAGDFRVEVRLRSLAGVDEPGCTFDVVVTGSVAA
jgi:hypothetical protein